MPGKRNPRSASDMRTVYDFAGGTRGKYARRYAAGTNVVLLDADVAKAFPDAATVNRALRALVDIAKSTKPTTPSRHRPKRAV